jgi:DNA-binding MarR family transcriptional regulator
VTKDGNGSPPQRGLGLLLRLPYQALTARVRDGLAAAGYDDIHLAHLSVFQNLGDGARASDLAARAQITKQSMGYLVDYLAARGYLERVPDPTDRRAMLIRPTARGRAVDRAARLLIDQLEQECAARIGEDRLQQLRGLLHELHVALST